MRTLLPVGGAIRASLHGATKVRSARVRVGSTLDSKDDDGVVTPDPRGAAAPIVSRSRVVAAGSSKAKEK